jgi:prevent-host-death family protein
MDSKTILSISEARRRIFEIAAEVKKPDTYFTLTENGRPVAVIMSAEEFESWQETMDVIRDLPDLDKSIMESEREFARGAYAVLEDLLAGEGFVVADQPRSSYAVRPSGRTFRKSRKKSRRKNR